MRDRAKSVEVKPFFQESIASDNDFTIKNE